MISEHAGANLVSDRKVDFSRHLGRALGDFYGYYSPRGLHMCAVAFASSRCLRKNPGRTPLAMGRTVRPKWQSQTKSIKLRAIHQNPITWCWPLGCFFARAPAAPPSSGLGLPLRAPATRRTKTAQIRAYFVVDGSTMLGHCGLINASLCKLCAERAQY